MNDPITPIRHEDTGELLGYVFKEASGWSARTIFRHVISRSETRRESEDIVRNDGLRVLAGVWRYYDTDDRQWHACKIQEAYEDRVVVTRTNELGFEDQDVYKRVIIKSPDETNLQVA